MIVLGTSFSVVLWVGLMFLLVWVFFFLHYGCYILLRFKQIHSALPVNTLVLVTAHNAIFFIVLYGRKEMLTLEMTLRRSS